jgi:protein-S-isoprenylcysteine O-methyltransferase Ste14
VAVLLTGVLVVVLVLTGVRVRVKVFVAPPTAVLVGVGLGAVGATVRLRVQPEMIANVRKVIPAKPRQTCERFMFPPVLGADCDAY